MDSSHEMIIPNDNLPFKLFLFEGGEGKYKRASHWHRSIEIFLVMKGEIDFYLGERHFSIGEKNFIIVNSNEVHSIDAPLPNRTLVLQIPVQTFEVYLQEQPYLSFSRRSGEQNEKLMGLVMEMYRTYENKAYAWELKVSGLFEFVKYLLLTEFKDTTNLSPWRRWRTASVFLPRICPEFLNGMPISATVIICRI